MCIIQNTLGVVFQENWDSNKRREWNANEWQEKSLKYLILGVNGMAGHMIAAYLREQGHSVLGFARSKSPLCPTYVGDIRAHSLLEKVVGETQFDYVVNCIGVLNQAVDRVLSDGIYLNSVLPHLLAEQLQSAQAKLIHISTDCVFEGTKGRYTEGDQPDAVSYYGRSKALGEVIDNRNLTIRTSIVGPELKTDGVGLLHWFLHQKGPVNGFERVIWSGVTTLQLAKFIAQDVENPRTGLYHLVNNQTISKYDLLLLFNCYFRENKIEIRRYSAPECNKSLRNTRQASPVPSYKEMVRELAEWMARHPDWYRQYWERGNA